MKRVDEISAQIPKLEAPSEGPVLTKKANLLAKIKTGMKLNSFKTIDFKVVLASGREPGTVTAVMKTVAKKIVN